MRAQNKVLRLFRLLWGKWQGSSLLTRVGLISLVVIAITAGTIYVRLQPHTPTEKNTPTTQATDKTGNTAPRTTSPSNTVTPPPTTSTPKPSSPKTDQGSTPATNGTTNSANSNSDSSSSGGGGTTQSPAFPDASTTGVPSGVSLHACATTITITGTYDACQFNGSLDIRANNVMITRSLIKGQVGAGSDGASDQTGLVIRNSTIDCGCLSTDDTHTPAAIADSNFSLLRVNIFNAGHGAAVGSNVTIQDSYIHGLGGNTEAHKDGIYSGNGTNVTIKHNNIECNDGPIAGCTSAIGLLTDFTDITYYTIDNNLLNTNGAYCFYGSGGPGKTYGSNHITFTNNHFGRKYNANCGFYGPVTYFDIAQPGMVWSGNVWDDTGEAVPPVY